VTEKAKSLVDRVAGGVAVAVVIVVMSVGFSLYRDNGNFGYRIGQNEKRIEALTDQLEKAVNKLELTMQSADDRRSQADGEIRGLALSNSQSLAQISTKMELLLSRKDDK